MRAFHAWRGPVDDATTWGMSRMRIILFILILWCAGLGAAGQFAKIAVPFTLLQDHYGGAGAALGWLLSVISALGMVFGMIAGIIVVKLGLRWPLIWAMVLGALISWGQSFLPGMPVMMALRFLEGLSHLVIVIAAPTLIGLIAPDAWRGHAMTLWSSFFGAAFAVTAIFGLPLAEARGVGALFAAHALWMAVIAGLLFLLPAGQVAAPPVPEDMSFRGILRRHAQAYASARISAPAWGWLFYTTSFAAGLAILPTLLAETDRIALSSAMPLLCIAVALSAVPVMMRFFVATRIAVMGFAAASVIALAGLLGLPMPLLCLLLFAVLGLVQGSSFAAIPQLNLDPRDQALANGAMAQTGNLGNMIGTPLLLSVLTHGGVPGLMLALALLYLGGAAVHQLLATRREWRI